LPTGQGRPYGSYVTAWRVLHCIPEELVVAWDEPCTEPVLFFEQSLDGHDGAWPVLAEHGSPWWLAVGEVLGEVGCVGCEEPWPGMWEVDAVGHVPGGVSAGVQHPYAGGDLGIAGELAPLHREVGVVRLVVAVGQLGSLAAEGEFLALDVDRHSGLCQRADPAAVV